MIKKLKGTYDILPSDIPVWRHIENTARECAERYGFGEISTPMFEYTELFARGMGETTDVVSKEMYTFPDRDERSLTLRPEGTAGVVRAIIESGLISSALPLKLFYIADFFRYERPQAGRSRQFRSFGIESFGSSEPSADAEVICLSDTFLRKLGLDNVELHLNSIGCIDCRPNYRAELIKHFASHSDSMCELCVSRMEKNPLRLLDCKNPKCGEIAAAAPSSIDYLCEPCETHMTKLLSLIDSTDIKYIINPKIVRGLDYYTRTVFEFISNDIGAQSTIVGGGRYDGLVSELGGNPTPAVGFGSGLTRLILALQSADKVPQYTPSCDLYIAAMGDTAAAESFRIAENLRRQGYSCETDTMQRSLKAQMRHADKLGARYTIVLGDNELESGSAKLKNMQFGDEVVVKLAEIATHL